MLKKIVKFVRMHVRRAGFDVIRYRSLHPTMVHHGISLVLDVGANTGQYGHSLRDLGYQGRIISFEPQRAPFATLAEAARRDGNWEAVNIGLGSADEQKEINVYQDSTLSSMLTFGQNYGAFDDKKIGTETIDVRTLDGLFDSYLRPGDKVLLKIDTQGFEKPVLIGAAQSLPKVACIQIEMSIAPLYAEQPLIHEIMILLQEKGFRLWQMLGGGPRLWATGQELEVDGVFVREDLFSK